MTEGNSRFNEELSGPGTNDGTVIPGLDGLTEEWLDEALGIADDEPLTRQEIERVRILCLGGFKQ